MIIDPFRTYSIMADFGYFWLYRPYSAKWIWTARQKRFWRAAPPAPLSYQKRFFFDPSHIFGEISNLRKIVVTTGMKKILK